MGSPWTLAAALGLSLLLAGCAGAGVRVVRLGGEAPPRPAGCAIEILEKPPERPHEKLAELAGTAVSSDGFAPLAVLKDPACRLGADALVVTHRTTPRGPQSMVAAVAIRWLPAAPEPAPPEQVPPRQPPGAVSL